MSSKASNAKAQKKGGGPNVAALKAALEAKKKAEEEAKLREEEELRRIEEEEKKRQEEIQRKEDEKRRKKEAQKAKKEQLKKEGKYLTKAQKEAQQRAQQRLQAMLASGEGIKVDGLVAASEGTQPEGQEKKKKVVYGKKKKNDKKNNDQKSDTASDVAVTPVETPAQPETQEEDVLESWEDMLKSEEEKHEEEKEEVKESWEDESNDESNEEAEKTNAVKTNATKGENKENKPQKKSTKSDSEEESDSDEESDSEEDEEQRSATQKEAAKKRQEAAERRQKRHEEALAARSKDDLRSPICVILGHVDTGKTKLLDKIRQTNVQEGEAGGITQQIGATYFPREAIETKTSKLVTKDEIKVPGLLVIDTPGHESFTNLRSRGSSLCNIAILVVDIMHGLEAQTLESLNLLKQRKTPFIVALNKVDRLYGWKATPDAPIQESLKKQSKHTIKEFEDRLQKTQLAFAEQGFNAVPYYDNKKLGSQLSLVPTSAITGEGIPDLLHLLVKLTQERMTDKLMYLSEVECTVLEVKVVEGLGTTIDVVLSNGVLNEGDRIVLCGMNGPIATNIRALLTPQPMRELRIKSAYVHHKQIKAAMGVKITAPDLDKAVAGSRLLVVTPEDDEDELKEDVMSDLTGLLDSIDRSGKGVFVQASTLGSLEALLSFLKDMKIPVSGINIGPVHKKDIIRCSVMLDSAREYAVMMAFDVKIDRDAQELAEEMGVKIFRADIIYHLFDAFQKHWEELMEQKKRDQAPQAVFPCELRIVPGCVFNKRNPIILGVDVVDGQLRVGTPIIAMTADETVVPIGRVTGIELNHKSKELVKKGEPAVAVKIECASYETPKLVGRHFTEKDMLYSHVSRASIDILKTTFRAEMSKEDWALVIKLKKLLKID